jgi:hypothetical protein
MRGHPGNHAASLTDSRGLVHPGAGQAEQIAADTIQKAGVVATRQHIGLVTVLHMQKAVKGCFSIDGGQMLLPPGCHLNGSRLSRNAATRRSPPANWSVRVADESVPTSASARVAAAPASRSHIRQRPHCRR